MWMLKVIILKNKKWYEFRRYISMQFNILEGITYKLFITALLYIDDIEDDNITYLEPAENLTKIR